ncbi:MAG: hypothetical protein JWQ97_3392 [Phenylobacterium sp.]|nr:hypothetical protein [Phenylobacterium sp.]
MSGHYPIPAEALDDRLAWTGTSGSGKTYNAGAGVEQLLASGARVIIIDPLDVWWGLRLTPDGEKPSRFKPVIFGGPRGDLPLNERSGPLLGETCAKMRESCIISLADFGSAADERRFMLGFLGALYRHANGEPVHLVVDEADLWAPQLILDKDGDAPKLLGQMNTIVRRGRIKGFIPWLITQRPAEISKGVLSQADGLLAFTLTSSQDRDAIGGWIKGQADAEAGRAILASLPSLQLGQGVIWIPRRGILETAQFPKKATFDSSRTPKRGEVVRTATLKSLDLGALKERLVAVEQEAKANDPKVLKAEIARLTAELKKVPPAGASDAVVERAKQEGYNAGHSAGFLEGVAEGEKRGNPAGQALMLTRAQAALNSLRVDKDEVPTASTAPRPPQAAVRQAAAPSPPPARPAAPTRSRPAIQDDSLTPAKQKILDALAWGEQLQRQEGASTSKVVIAFHVGMNANGGGFNNYLGALRSSGFITYPQPGMVALTDDGRARATAPSAISNSEVQEAALAKVQPQHRRVMEIVLRAYPDQVSREDVAAEVGMNAGGGGFNNYLGRLRSLLMLDYPAPGFVRATDFLFPENHQ